MRIHRIGKEIWVVRVENKGKMMGERKQWKTGVSKEVSSLALKYGA